MGQWLELKTLAEPEGPVTIDGKKYVGGFVARGPEGEKYPHVVPVLRAVQIMANEYLGCSVLSPEGENLLEDTPSVQRMLAENPPCFTAWLCVLAADPKKYWPTFRRGLIAQVNHRDMLINREIFDSGMVDENGTLVQYRHENVPKTEA